MRMCDGKVQVGNADTDHSKKENKRPFSPFFFSLSSYLGDVPPRVRVRVAAMQKKTNRHTLISERIRERPCSELVAIPKRPFFPTKPYRLAETPKDAKPKSRQT